MPTELSLPLKDQWALVTGATGSIGSAVAAALSADGANLVLHTHSQQSRAQELATRLRCSGSQVEIVAADLASPSQREQLINDIWQRGPLDLLVNIAGVDVLTGENAQLSFGEKLELLWQVDAHGSIHLSRGFGHRMQQRGRGSIVNLGWDQAEQGMGGDSGEMFAAIKGSVMAFTRSLAKSLAPQVRVNCIAPGWIRTKWATGAASYWQGRAVGESLLARWGKPEDVAEAVRFLASPAADFVNGQVLTVNGGWAGLAPTKRNAGG